MAKNGLVPSRNKKDEAMFVTDGQTDRQSQRQKITTPRLGTEINNTCQANTNDNVTTRQHYKLQLLLKSHGSVWHCARVSTNPA